MKEGEDFAGWRDRLRSDIAWGQEPLSSHIRSYRPLAFAPAYGNPGQDGINGPRIPGDLLGWLIGRYDAVFTQDRNARAKPGDEPPYGRIHVNRRMAGGDLYELLLTGEQ